MKPVVTRIITLDEIIDSIFQGINLTSKAIPFEINIQPVGRRVIINDHQNILEASRLGGVEIIALCGGIGSCDSCKIRVISGIVSNPTIVEEEVFEASELRAGFRLACQVYPKSDLKIEIPPQSLSTPQRLQIEGQKIQIKPSPAVKKISIEALKPSLDDMRSDADRLKDEILKRTKIIRLEFDLGVLQIASQILRENGWRVTAVLHGSRVIGILPPDRKLFGLAVDIGTTKLAAYLVDLSQGIIVAQAGMMNPQISYGEDVVSRIAYANTEAEGRQVLQSKLVEALNDLINKLIFEARESGVDVLSNQIVDAVIVGNTAMHHIFSGLSVEQLGRSPYVPVQSDAMLLPARDLGLKIGVGAFVYLPAVIAGFIGADHTAMVLSTKLHNMKETCLALDIGTNTEITLTHEGQLYSCSCASGPAFEGAHIQSGMRASHGAIERVQIEGNTIRFFTIGDVKPVGICGSGILDAIAQMLNEGILDHRGVIHPVSKDKTKSCFESHFLLVDQDSSGHNQPIFITRKDVNEIQLAKGAIRSGIEILLREAGIQANQIQKFYIAGAFGTYLGIESAIKVGMFPPLPVDRFHQVGNAAGAGAVLLLLSKEQREISDQFVRKVKYIELSNHPNFTSVFAEALFFDQQE